MLIILSLIALTALFLVIMAFVSWLSQDHLWVPFVFAGICLPLTWLI